MKPSLQPSLAAAVTCCSCHLLQPSLATAVADAAACAPEWAEILRQMIFIRRFEEATEREFRRGKIGGYLHVYSGQEAVAVGVLGATKKADVVFAGYRDHAAVA